MIEYKDGINLNLYRIFYYVAKEGSISAAAKKIMYHNQLYQNH